MCPSLLAASARGGSEGESGAEAGADDACLEMRTGRRGCIVDDGRGSLVLGASSLRFCYRSSDCRNTERRGKKETYEL